MVAGTISNLNKKIYARIEEWHHRSIEEIHSYPDDIVMSKLGGVRFAIYRC